MLKTKKFMLIVAQGLIISPLQCKHQCIPPAQTFIRSSRRNHYSQSMALKKSLKDWSFTDSKLSSLPLDPEVENFIRDTFHANYLINQDFVYEINYAYPYIYS